MHERDLLMQTLQPADRSKLFVIVPTPMMTWMETYKAQLVCSDWTVLIPSVVLNAEPCYYYQSQFDFKDDYKGIEAETSLPLSELPPSPSTCEALESKLAAFAPKTPDTEALYLECREALGLEKIIAVEVDHCPQSYGCLLVLSDGQRMIYSGDTLPCQNFKNYAMGCKLLIHEATFESGMDDDAKMKKHTTTAQALGLAKEVGAWRTILTHFSPRYSKVSEISDEHFQ